MLVTYSFRFCCVDGCLSDGKDFTHSRCFSEVCVGKGVCVCVCVCVYVYTYVCVCVWMYMYMYVYAYMCIYIYYVCSDFLTTFNFNSFEYFRSVLTDFTSSIGRELLQVCRVEASVPKRSPKSSNICCWPRMGPEMCHSDTQKISVI